jgi:dolichol-phosphate mannosyltransferase
MSPLISLVIPVRNEETALQDLLPAVEREIRLIRDDIEVIIVDDASTDHTRTVVKEFIQDKTNYQLLERKSLGGQTGCYHDAFKQAKGEYIIRMDGDGQDDPSDLKVFVEKIKEGNQIVVGLRSQRSHDALQIFGSRLFDLMALLFFRSPFFANSSSFVAFEASLVKDIPLTRTLLFRNEHRYLVLIALSKHPGRYTEIIVKHRPRQGGKSKYSKMGKYFWAFGEFFILFFRINTGYYKKHS